MKRLLFLLFLSVTAYAENVSMGWMAAETSWNTKFTDLQTPGWNTAVHPGGILDLQIGPVFVEAGGDPHRPREATSFVVGLRKDFWRKGRVAIYGQVSAGVFEAPSFLEYCGSYEYEDGNCGAGTKEPEYCFWATLNAGAGVRIKLTHGFDLEPARFEYLSPYGIGPRWRFSSGFRVYLNK